MLRSAYALNMILSAPTLQTCLQSRQNNFDPLRLLFAALVLVAHAFPIAEGVDDPLASSIGVGLGYLAVAAFFVISGCLIARSFERDPRLTRFVSARLLRIMPGLIVVIVLTALVLGPLVTLLPLGQYFGDPRTWLYLPRNISLFFLQYPLPGVFEGNPYGPPINGSLWTLRYEMLGYMLVPIAAYLGLSRSRAIAAFIVLLVCSAWIVAENATALHPLLKAGVMCATPFALGWAANVWKDRLPLSFAFGVLLVLACVLSWGTPIFSLLVVISVCYLTLVLALHPSMPHIPTPFGADLSYGTYIYAFPVQQTLVFLGLTSGWVSNTLLALLITLLLATGSWFLVERRALGLLHQWFPKTARAPAVRDAARVY